MFTKQKCINLLQKIDAILPLLRVGSVYWIGSRDAGNYDNPGGHRNKNPALFKRREDYGDLNIHSGVAGYMCEKYSAMNTIINNYILVV